MQSHLLVRRKQDANKRTWEESEFPILCETCLGEIPYIRMTKEGFGKECKVCTRPFTVFRWRPGPRARFKKTEICQTCAKLKNICQTCLLDLQYGLPVQVRDHALPNPDAIPESDVNREYFMDQAERKINEGQLPWAQAAPDAMLKHLSYSQPYYKRNLPRICSFFLKGECNRGKECPYRHDEAEEEKEQPRQNIKDRYYGVNDPVANKLLNRANQSTLEPPADPEVKTIYLGGVSPEITESNINGKFYEFGEIESISMLPKLECAFVTFATREAAENAVAALYKNLIINQKPLQLAWGKSHNSVPSLIAPSTSSAVAIMPPASIPPAAAPFTPLISLNYYPSMNPSALGSTGDLAPTSNSLVSYPKSKR